MFRALWGKEWKQLRPLRWIGFGLGLLLPPFLLTVTEAAHRGWLPFGSVGSYAVDDLFLNALPALTLGLWGLLTLLFTAQSFAGDRSAGTEQFLLDRPVPRSKIWAARLLASLASALVLYLALIAYWALVTRIAVGPETERLLASLGTLASGGLLVIGIFFLAGVAAATLVTAPIAAALLGLILAVVPAALATMLAGLFPMASLAMLPIGAVIPWILLPAYLVASFAIACRGEPAGRGRLKRGLSVLFVALLAIPILFLILAPLMIRSGAFDLYWIELISPRDSGAAICVQSENWNSRAGWIVDVEKKQKVRFLPPPIWEAAWSPDGSRLAVVHSAGKLGGLLDEFQLDLFDASGSRVLSRALPEENLAWIEDLIWVGDELAVSLQTEMAGGSAILLFDPRTGRVRRFEIVEPSFRWGLVGPTDNGQLFVYRLVDPKKSRFELLRLDLDRGELIPEPLLEEQGFTTYSGKWISPSGRYWLRNIGDFGEGMLLHDFETGTAHTLDECSWARWLAGDRLLCLEPDGEGSRLTLGPPGAPRRELKSWPGQGLAASVSPDLTGVLVQVWDPADAEQDSETGYGVWIDDRWWKIGHGLRETLVLDADSLGWTDLTRRVPEVEDGHRLIPRWASNDTIALTGRSSFALLDVAGDEPPTWVFGRP